MDETKSQYNGQKTTLPRLACPKQGQLGGLRGGEGKRGEEGRRGGRGKGEGKRREEGKGAYLLQTKRGRRWGGAGGLGQEWPHLYCD